MLLPAPNDYGGPRTEGVSRSVALLAVLAVLAVYCERMSNRRAFVVVVLVLALILPFQLAVGGVYAVVDAVLPDGDQWLARIAIMACLIPPFMVAYGLAVAGIARWVGGVRLPRFRTRPTPL